MKTLEQVARDVGEETADRLADAVRKIFSRVLRELSDIDNPMRTAVGSESGNGALLEDAGTVEGPSQARDPDEEPPAFGGEVPDLPPPVEPEAHSTALPGRTTRPLPDIAPDPDPDGYRSRFDADQSIVSITTTAIPTTCWSRRMKAPCSTTWPRWWPRSMCSTTIPGPGRGARRGDGAHSHAQC